MTFAECVGIEAYTYCNTRTIDQSTILTMTRNHMSVADNQMAQLLQNRTDAMIVDPLIKHCRSLIDAFHL